MIFGIRTTGAFAAVAFGVLWLVEPRADQWGQPLSAYALTGSRPLWQLCLVLTAVTVLLVARLPSVTTHAIERRALGATIVGLLALALVPTDPWFPWERLPTPHGAFHVLASAVAMSSFAVFAIAFMRRQRNWRAMLLPGLYVVGLGATVASVLILVAVGRSPRFIGFAEWVLLGLALACCVTAAPGPILRTDSRSFSR